MKYILSIFLFCISFASFGQKILFENNFDDKQDKFSWVDKCCSYSFTIDSTHAAQGKYSQRVEFRRDETQMGNTDGKRADASWNTIAYSTPTNTQQAWFRISVMLSSDWAIENNNPESIFAMHDGESCANRATNPFGIWVNGDHYEAIINASPNTDYCSGGYSQIARKATLNLGPIQPGKYVTFIIHYRNSITDGYDSVFDGAGKLLGSYKGPNWYKGIFPEPYLKMGIYKWGYKTSSIPVRVLYQDNIKIGDTSCRLNQFILSTAPPVTNKPPVANAGLDQLLTTGANGQTRTTLKGTATDPDGDAMTYFWKTFQTPTGWYGTSTNPTWSISGYVPGVYKYEFTATDSKGAVGRDTMVVTVVSPNTAPVIDSVYAIQQINPIATALIGVAARDNENDPLTYEWKDQAGQIVSTSKEFTKQFTISGDYSYTVTVSDGKLTAISSALVRVQFNINLIKN